MRRVRTDVLVIGAGVVGLTTAVTLAEAGVGVRVRADRRPTETTSFAAGAIWGPYLVRHPHAAAWGWETFDVLKELAASPDETGVRMVGGIEASREHECPPDWVTDVPGYRPCTQSELPDGFVSGWYYVAPIIDMSVYLAYLERRLGNAGVKIETGHVASIEDALTQAAIAINCTGFGARDLVPDDQMTPIRGQLVVADNPGLTEFFAESSDESELTYFLPQGEHVILGGTAEKGEHEMVADPAAAARIIKRCAAIEPRLADVPIRALSRVGIRPSRPEVRVEHVSFGRRHVIHNYGHGGAGVSLSWGCAHEVRDIAVGLISA
ncbi:FAD-dependent oxidoreductase [Rugosimonospora acidiphila]|uniref:D-amino-acid oxidase n=1 Tax=Rugosimonospora acidiphila TaxID=556531 RepID=A0ABP9SFA7_9ACTN